ncbi:MAG: hypothetical protein LAN62_13495 [Acidobacteriia bacterium]|nr:hypothetical protein [Terriglobia bacterium]
MLRRMVLVAGEAFENLRTAADLLVKNGHPGEALEFLSARVKAVPWDAQGRLELARAQLASNRDRGAAQTGLSSLAAAPEAPYATRAAAAQAFAAFQASGINFGSGELDLLAKGVQSDPSSVEQPGYFYARMQAAERVADAATRVRLLLGAVEIQPQDDSPRVPLFRAAAAIEKHALAYSAVEPLLDQGASGYYQNPDQAENAEASEDAEAEAYMGPSDAVTLLPRIELRAEEKVALAAQVAQVLEKLQRLREAAGYWAIAAALAPPGPSREGFQGKLNAARAKLKLERQDALRRPVVSEHLEQKGQVRPRLKAKSQGVGGSSTEGGGGG